MSYRRFSRETQACIRKKFSSSDKFSIAHKQSLLCPCELCKNRKRLPPEFDLDHIVPLWAGGSNDLDNIQAICPNGHRLKTATEERNYWRERRIDKWKRLKSFVLVEEANERVLVDQLLSLIRRGHKEAISSFFKELKGKRAVVKSKYFS